MCRIELQWIASFKISEAYDGHCTLVVIGIQNENIQRGVIVARSCFIAFLYAQAEVRDDALRIVKYHP